MSSRIFKEFLKRASEVDTDVTITVVDKNERQLVTCTGHKVILSAWSIVFKNLFEIYRQEDVYKFKLPTSQPEVLEQIFSWMYTQKFRVSDENIPALLKIADFLLIEPLVENIIAYLKKILAKQNCLTIWRACQAEKLPLRLMVEITKCLIVDHKDILGGPELTPDEQELISAMQGYITVFLDSERNLRKFKFLASVWEFVVGHSHGQQMQEILDKLLQDVVGVARG